MSGWRAALVAAVVGGLVLLAGWAIPRFTGDNPTTTTGGSEPPEGGATIACPSALRPACDALGAELGAAVRTWSVGAPVGEDEVVIAPAADLPDGVETAGVLARSPIVLASWLERNNVLSSACEGTVDLACVNEALGKQWVDLGGRDTWGAFKVGLADPTRSEAGMAAWQTVAGGGVPDGLGDSLQLISEDDGRLMADMLLFGAARADAVVTTEVAVASQLANAPGRGGRLVVAYPDPAPWVEYVVSPGEARAARRLADALLDPDLAALYGPAGLRPPQGDAVGLPDGLGTPGQPASPADAAQRQALLDDWSRVAQQ